MPKTQEEIRATNRECVKRWKKTDRGRKKCAEQQARWRKTPHGIAYTKAYSERVKGIVKEKKRTPEGKAKTFKYYLDREYGISVDTYNVMMSSQGNKCAICGCGDWAARGKRAHLDHDHGTGKVRGILCHSCNIAIGLLSDSANTAYSAAVYLRGN